MRCNYKAMVPFLLDWYDYNARILPWRENPRPYHIWISEIMLQQTRVEAVKGYFDRFITALPSISDLADAEEETLLKLWEGLGYYNRVRNLQKAARMVVQEYQGILPSDYEKLLQFPGVGSYTAGAIASIAFQIPVPAVDGNVLRIMKRIAGSFDDITKEKTKKELWQDIMEMIPKDRPGDFNQSLMELGATICIPNGKPLCNKCPVVHLCKAFHNDTVTQIPVKPAKKQRRVENRTILLFEYQDRYALKKRDDKGLLAGLWELPGLEEKREIEELKKMLRSHGIYAEKVTGLGEAKHIFSHIEWHMIGYYITLADIISGLEKEEEFVWANIQEINTKYSIPNAFSAFLTKIKDN